MTANFSSLLERTTSELCTGVAIRIKRTTRLQMVWRIYLDWRATAKPSTGALLLIPAIGWTDPVEVRYREGEVHGFLEPQTLDGKKIAYGESIQTVRGSLVTSRLLFRKVISCTAGVKPKARKRFPRSPAIIFSTARDRSVSIRVRAPIAQPGSTTARAGFLGGVVRARISPPMP